MPQRVTMPDGTVVEMPDTLTPEMGAWLRSMQEAQSIQMAPSHTKAPTSESMSSHKGAVPFTSPVDKDVEIMSKLIGPERAYQAIKASDYKPGAVAALVQPDTSAVGYLNNATGQMGSGIRDVTQGQANTVQHILGRVGIVSPEDLAYSDAVMNARMAGDDASWGSDVPRVGRFVGNAAAALSPISLLGKASRLAQQVRAARAAWLARTAGAGATYGTAGAMVQPGATPGSVMEGGAFGAVAGPLVEGGVYAGGLVLSGAKKLGATRSPAEVLDELGQRLGGKKPGEALHDAANAKYNAAWDEFKGAIAPVDAEAGSAGVNYSPAISKIEDVLGIGKKRSPMPMDKDARETITELLANLQEAQKPGGTVDNSFAGAIDAIKNLGGIQRNLAKTHGSTVAREMVGDIRDAILKAMEESNPNLSAKYQEARKVFATKVAPLFDKSEGGNYLTQVRDSATPGDLLAEGNQGSLARMKPDRAAIIAKGSSADPLLYSYLDAAISQAKGNPGSFQNSISKAMPAIEAIADPQMLQSFKGLEKVAKTSKFAGWLANTAGGYLAGGGIGAVAGSAATISPKFTGPGLIWRLLQSPATRKLLETAGKLSVSDPALELIGRDLAKTLQKSIPVASAPPNITPLQLPKAAGEGTPDTASK